MIHINLNLVKSHIIKHVFFLFNSRLFLYLVSDLRYHIVQTLFPNHALDVIERLYLSIDSFYLHPSQVSQREILHD